MVQLIVECAAVERVEERITKIGRLKYRLPMISALVVEVPEGSAAELSSLPGVTAVFENTRITAQAAPAVRKPAGARQAAALSEPNTCGLSGRGVTIAVLDTGVAPVADFSQPQNRLLGFADFVEGKDTAYDDNGHGTHVAGIAAGNGLLSNGLYMGIAPESGIVGIKTLDKTGKGSAVELLAGLQWVLDNKERYQIRIVNLSVGASEPSDRDPLVRAVEAVWDMGLCVVVAAGNNGPKPGSITSPGVSRKVITVGALDDDDEVEVMGTTARDYSGRGPTAECIVKPDILAPGADIVAVRAPESHPGKPSIAGHYLKLSGTSMATPIVSGAIALLLERSPRLTPDDVKYMLRTCAADLHFPRNRQGCGELDIGAVLREEAIYVRSQ